MESLRRSPRGHDSEKELGMSSSSSFRFNPSWQSPWQILIDKECPEPIIIRELGCTLVLRNRLPGNFIERSPVLLSIFSQKLPRGLFTCVRGWRLAHFHLQSQRFASFHRHLRRPFPPTLLIFPGRAGSKDCLDRFNYRTHVRGRKFFLIICYNVGTASLALQMQGWQN